MDNLSFKQYIKTFDSFGQYSEEYNHQLKHLLHIGNQHLKRGFSVLDIGAGTGFFIRDFLDGFKNMASSYTAIEPSKEHVNKIKQNFQALPLELEICNEIFTPQTDFKQKFDLIVMSHSLYWFMPDPEPYILNALKLLEEDGIAVMYLQTPYSASHILNLLFKNVLPENRTPNHEINSWTILDILDENNINYKISNLPGTFNGNHLFKPEHKELLHELISFFLSIQAESTDYITLKRAEEALNKLSYKNGKDVKLNLEVGAITVLGGIPKF